MKSIRYPTMMQSSISDCGASCLYMLLKYYGGFETLENLKKLTHTGKEGTSLFHLKEAAMQLGFEAIGYQVTYEELKRHKFPPFIAHVLIDESYYHYVVVYKIKGNKLWVADPSFGYIKVIKEDVFCKIFEQTILVLYPQMPLISTHKNPKLFSKWFFSILKKNKKTIISIAILSFFITLLELANVSSFYVFLKIIKSNNIHLLILFSILFILLTLIKNILDLFRKNKIANYEEKTAIYLKKSFWQNTLSLPYRESVQKSRGEALMKVEEIEKQNLFLLQIVIFFFFDFLTFLCVGGILLFYKKMSFFFIGYCLLQFLIELRLVKKEKEVLLELKKLESSETQSEVEVLESISSIKETNLEKNIENVLNEKIKIIEKEKKKIQKQIFIYHFIHNIINQSFLLLMSVTIVLLIMKKTMYLEDYVMICYLFSLISNFFENLLNLLIQKEEAKWILEGMTFSKIEEKEPSCIEKIEFKQAKFLPYGNIKNISFTLKRGIPILLLGKSGIGKSTLALSVKGYYPIKGRYINNELKEEMDTSYQNRVVYISSQNYMYTDSILENINMKRNVDEKKFKSILKLTHVDKILEKKPKLFLFENGQNLSSGEKQKISLARSLLNDFDVLILDEALNKIDEIEEKEIMIELLEYFKNKCILVISHRTNLKRIFSKIFIFTNHGQLKKIKRKEKLCLEESLETYLKS